MRRHLLAALVLVTVVPMTLAACAEPKPSLLTDAKEIISRGLAATRDAKSFHVDVQLSGRLAPQSGGISFNLDQSTASGDFDVANGLGRVTFDAPGLFGLSGELIQVGADSYLKTKLTGPKYRKLTTEAAGPAADPDQILATVSSFLDQQGVQTAKLDDLSCGDGTCYHVTLTVPAQLLSGVAGSVGVDLGQIGADALELDLQFDQQTMRLVQVSTDIDGGDAGTASMLLIVSRYDQAVEVSPPPSDQVTEGLIGS